MQVRRMTQTRLGLISFERNSSTTAVVSLEEVEKPQLRKTTVAATGPPPLENMMTPPGYKFSQFLKAADRLAEYEPNWDARMKNVIAVVAVPTMSTAKEKRVVIAAST